ncbi:hypothetical protein [Variovorax sp. JS1663]|uniref:hypothetical protein n=1 Tax=Variovorax sp. JS1663 TaxID=1851577 RepID=UPI00118062A6|nr:hypothetical protein [Variovorax sp. JS1663]
MHSTICSSSLVGPIDGGQLGFEVIRLPGKNALGVVRRLKMTGVGLYEMAVLFDSHDAFLAWISADEYRHHAPCPRAGVLSTCSGDGLRSTPS